MSIQKWIVGLVCGCFVLSAQGATTARKHRKSSKSAVVKKSDSARKTREKTTVSSKKSKSSGVQAREKTREKPEIVKKTEMVKQPSGRSVVNGRPAMLSSGELQEFQVLSDSRKALIEEALRLGEKHYPYRMGASSPAEGALDCSGAMAYVLSKRDIRAPRTAQEQYDWIRASGKLHVIPRGADSLSAPIFANLQPGDLVFWSGTYSGVDISHVAMYLGHEKSDGRAVMINATRGRSYRGQKANGYGVYDFRIPRNSIARMVAFGAPVGITESKGKGKDAGESFLSRWLGAGKKTETSRELESLKLEKKEVLKY